MDENNIPKEPILPDAPAPEPAASIPEAPKAPPVPPRHPYVYTPIPKITYPTGTAELIFGAVVILFALLVCNGLLFAGANLAFSIGIIGTMSCTFGYLYSRKHRPDRYSAALLILSLVIVAAFPRGNDGFLKFVAICILIVLPSLSFCLMSRQNRFAPSGILSLLDGFLALFALGFGKMGEAGRGVRKGWSSTGKLGKTSSSVLLGLLIAVPLLAILIPLLMFADAAFEGLLDLLPEFEWQEILITLLFGTGLGCVLYTRGVALQHQEKSTPRSKARKGLSSITVNTVLCCVCFVYVVYLFSQLAYFVGGFSGILPEEYTLAQYARRGFFEMGWLCAINLSVISLSVGLITAKEKPGIFTKILCLFIGLVTLFLVATASAKMLLYIRSYGLTRLRVITEVFMLWLALTTIFVCVWLFRPKAGYMKQAVLTFLVLFSLLLWADVDTQVAKYNVRAYQNGTLSTVDVSHLSGLSDGAVPYIYELATDSNPEIAQMARDVLRLRTTNGEDFRSWNYASGKAAGILDRFRAEDIGRILELDLTGCTAEVLKNTRNTRTQPLEYAVAVKLTDAQQAVLAGELPAPYWHSFPLPPQLLSVLYGSAGKSGYRGPFFTDHDGKVQIPEITSGKFYYLDRSPGILKDCSWITLHNDYEMHFTLAVWDSENNILYFFLKDT